MPFCCHPLPCDVVMCEGRVKREQTRVRVVTRALLSHTLRHCRYTSLRLLLRLVVYALISAVEALWMWRCAHGLEVKPPSVPLQASPPHHEGRGSLNGSRESLITSTATAASGSYVRNESGTQESGSGAAAHPLSPPHSATGAADRIGSDDNGGGGDSVGSDNLRRTVVKRAGRVAREILRYTYVFTPCYSMAHLT